MKSSKLKDAMHAISKSKGSVMKIGLKSNLASFTYNSLTIFREEEWKKVDEDIKKSK